jgi:hypothetical protein
MNNYKYLLFFLVLISSCVYSINKSEIIYSKYHRKNIEIDSYIEFTNDIPGNHLIVSLKDTSKNKFDMLSIKIKVLEDEINYYYRSFIDEHLGYVAKYQFKLTNSMLNKSSCYTLFFSIKYRKSEFIYTDSVTVHEKYRSIVNDPNKKIDMVFPRLGH